MAPPLFPSLSSSIPSRSRRQPAENRAAKLPCIRLSPADFSLGRRVLFPARRVPGPLQRDRLPVALHFCIPQLLLRACHFGEETKHNNSEHQQSLDSS